MPKINSPRLKFPSGEQRKYIENVLKISGLGTAGIAKVVKLPPRTINDWRREVYSISEKAVDKFTDLYSVNLPLPKSLLINKWLDAKSKANRIGGLVYYKKHGLGTPEGRRRGGMAGIAKLRELGKTCPVKSFDKPELSTKLAEFFGIMLGDGSINKFQINITLNSIADADYSPEIK